MVLRARNHVGLPIFIANFTRPANSRRSHAPLALPNAVFFAPLANRSTDAPLARPNPIFFAHFAARSTDVGANRAIDALLARPALRFDTLSVLPSGAFTLRRWAEKTSSSRAMLSQPTYKSALLIMSPLIIIIPLS